VTTPAPAPLADAAGIIARYQARIEPVLERWLPPTAAQPGRLHEAMRYSVLGSGKRIRPVLCYAAGAALGLPAERLDGPAAAVELIHAYSLVHDDLPAMDDDDLRRGRPTTHRAFDEATAILVGDALQVLAFEILATDGRMTRDAASRLAMIRLLAAASGTYGMAGGQALDLAAVGRVLTLREVEEMHARKTGALLRASVMLAAEACADLDRARRAALDSYSTALGLAFQIVDDLLDIEGDPQLVGKPVRADAARAKPTYPHVAGVASARARAAELEALAQAALAPFGPEAHELRQLARFIVERTQ
jgi:farnesyl diphosphate synthase